MQQIPFRYRIIATPLKLFFKFLYTQLAWAYDWIAALVSGGKWNEWVLTIVPYLQGRTILELGFGPGHLLSELLRKGYRIVGVDASMQMCRRAGLRLGELVCNKVIVNGYAQRIPLSSTSFEHVVATFPSDYIIDPLTMSEIWRILIPGGSLIVLPLAWTTTPKWYEWIADYLLRLSSSKPEWESYYLNQFCRQGFEAIHEIVHLDKSTVSLIIVQKPALKL
jgi:ubiquinone/menaquinone biosynthesis C-methylase UbiE